MESDEGLLLDLLNTTPVMDRVPRDELADAEAGARWLADHGQPASEQEWRALVEVRDLLQAVVHDGLSTADLAPFVEGVRSHATLRYEGVTWTLDLPEGRSAAARAVLTWDRLRISAPGRLRPCANPDCRLFLIDHSKPNSARWCSMAVCGNRMKARRHYQRARSTD
ncbi:zf-CGNR multi-domain protein [Pseudonocardiaceae bacterium YIM PH 21723]|nr:zf-CGNR multi-domain protein [Pseudonocardiaceae bacterium YIM PH 21723]